MAAWLTSWPASVALLVRAASSFPLNLHSGGIDNALGGCGDFWTDAFAGNQGDLVSHGCIVLYAMALWLSKAPRNRVAGKERCFVRVEIRFCYNRHVP